MRLAFLVALVAMAAVAPSVGGTGAFVGWPDCMAGCRGVQVVAEDALRAWLLATCGGVGCDGSPTVAVPLPAAPPSLGDRACHYILGASLCVDP